MSLSKGKFKVSYIWTMACTLAADYPWRKAPAAEVTAYVPYASQNANEHDASTEDLAYHVNHVLVALREPHINPMHGSPTRGSHQAQSPAPPSNTSPTPFPRHP
jgi:hypothetical protein